MTIFIYINDRLLDLSEKTSIAFTYQTGGIGDIRSRFVSHTNEFQVDKSENNTKIFGYADNIKTTSEIPYRRATAKILIDGLQVIKGFAFLRESSKTFRISVFETVIDFFSLIEGVPLSELDFGDAPVSWDAAYIDSIRAAVSGLVAPVIQYGQIDPTLVNAEIGDVYLPSIYYKTIIDAIFDNAGYTKTGDVFTDTKYSKLILPYSKSSWPGLAFTMDQIMPDLTQDEFIKHFSMAFGAIFKESGGEITVKLFEEIINDRVNSVDWTSKRATNLLDRIVYGFANYGQNNNFRNEDAEGAAALVIDNENLDLNVDIYTSPFTGVYADEFIANDNGDIVNGAIVPVWYRAGWVPPTQYPPDEDFFTNPVPRLLQVRNRIAPEPAILFDGNSRTDYLVGNYNSNFGNASSAWTSGGSGIGFLDIYYVSLQDRISRAKTIERFYNLTLLDIAQLDLFRLVYDDGAYYFINKIVNFIPGKVTKVELFKV